MDAKSKDMAADAAISIIKGFGSVADLKAFISENEDRTTVLKAAEAKMGELMAKGKKQGEEDDRMTKTTSDFKKGVEGAKDAGKPEQITCMTAIKNMRAKGHKI